MPTIHKLNDLQRSGNSREKIYTKLILNAFIILIRTQLINLNVIMTYCFHIFSAILSFFLPGINFENSIKTIKKVKLKYGGKSHVTKTQNQNKLAKPD